MFVTDNRLSSVKKYFKNALESHFSASEIRFMFNLFCEKRLQLSEAYFSFEENMVSESDLLYFRSVTKRLLAGEPFQQIIGFALFYDLRIHVTPDVLIPRPETEELARKIVADCSEKRQENLKIIDVCSGSGCIALSLKNKLKYASVFGLEKSEQALSVAQKNAQYLQLDVNFQTCDVLHEKWNFTATSIDVIVSNPPYVLQEEKVAMSDTVLNYEPHLALFVENDDPLLFYRKIGHKGQELLKQNGYLYFEINEKYGKEVADLLKNQGYENVEILCDLEGKERMIKSQKTT